MIADRAEQETGADWRAVEEMHPLESRGFQGAITTTIPPECSLDFSIPALKTSNLCDFAAEHSHVSVIARLKHTSADNVVHVHCLLFLLCHVVRQVDPKSVLANLMLIVLAVKVYRISFKLKA
jgi:hypothetical protein